MAGTIAGSLIFDTKTDTTGFDKGVSDIDKKADKMSDSFKKLGVAIVAAFSVSAIKSFGQILIETTAGLQAMDAQFDQIFKGAEGEKAMKALNEQSEELGIHTDILKKSYNSFGAQLKGAGLDAQKSLEGTTKATSLAADAAAFYDTSMETASASLASFLKGNFEAGDAIGVFTNATQMSTAAQKEYKKSWDKLTEAEKQWLLLDKVSEVYELNGAVGQAIREQNNWAIVSGNLRAEWDRFLEVVGAPVLENVVAIVKGLTVALGALVAVMQENPAAVSTFMNLILALLGGLTTYLIVKNISGMVLGLSNAFTVFGASLASPAGKAAILAAIIFTLAQMLIGLNDAWDDMSGAERLIAVLGFVSAAALTAFIAVGAFQSALTMGIAAAGIVAGIIAMTAALKSAEAKAKASTPSGNNYASQYSSALPRMATGGVIPPNAEFLAILGDQKHGTNVEAPLTTIQDALRNVLRERGGTGGGNTTVILQVDGRELARVTAPYNAGETNRLGTRFVNELG